MGMPVPAFQTGPGRYHISSCLEIAREGVLKKRFSAIRPILEAAGEVVKVCLLPIPRFVKQPCCKDGGHITNFMEDDFEDILIGPASTCRSIVSSEGEKAGLSLLTFDPVSAFCGRLQLEDDPVHLTASAYKIIASLVQNQANLVVQGKLTSGRRRIDSIVTGQQLVPVPAVLQVPGWITGTESRSGGLAEAAGASVEASGGTAVTKPTDVFGPISNDHRATPNQPTITDMT